MKSVAIKLIKAIGFLLAAFLIYLAYYWWDMRQLKSFCDDVKAGTPVSELRQIAEQHGINLRWINGDGILNQDKTEWSYYVPSTASAGANVCAIHHNKSTVISSVIEID